MAHQRHLRPLGASTQTPPGDPVHHVHPCNPVHHVLTPLPQLLDILSDCGLRPEWGTPHAALAEAVARLVTAARSGNAAPASGAGVHGTDDTHGAADGEAELLEVQLQQAAQQGGKRQRGRGLILPGDLPGVDHSEGNEREGGEAWRRLPPAVAALAAEQREARAARVAGVRAREAALAAAAAPTQVRDGGGWGGCTLVFD